MISIFKGGMKHGNAEVRYENRSHGSCSYAMPYFADILELCMADDVSLTRGYGHDHQYRC